MNLPLHNHEKTLAMLQHDEHSNATDRNLRKHSVWQKAEGEGRKQWEEASKNYIPWKMDLSWQGVGPSSARGQARNAFFILISAE